MKNELVVNLIMTGANTNKIIHCILLNEKCIQSASVARLLYRKDINTVVKLSSVDIMCDKLYVPSNSKFNKNNHSLIQINPACKNVTRTLLHGCLHAVTDEMITNTENKSNIHIDNLNIIKVHVRDTLVQKGINPNRYSELHKTAPVSKLMTGVFTNKEIIKILKDTPSIQIDKENEHGTTKKSFDEIVSIINSNLGGNKLHQPLLKEFIKSCVGFENNKVTTAKYL